MQKFIVALFTIDKTWMQSRCPSADEEINKLCYVQKMEYYSGLKKEKLSGNENTWRQLKRIVY